MLCIYPPPYIQFAVIAGNAAEVSNTGLVKPTKNYGETIIRITDSEKESFLHVTTEDYAPVYADARITAFLDENITADIMDVIAVNKHILGIQQLTPTGSKQADTD